MILMSIYALTKRLLVRPFTDVLNRATALQDQSINKEDKRCLKNESKRVDDTANNTHDLKSRRSPDNSFSGSGSSYSPYPPQTTNGGVLGLTATGSRKEMLSLTHRSPKGLTCVSGASLTTRKLRHVGRTLIIFIVLAGLFILTLGTWLIVRQLKANLEPLCINSNEDVTDFDIGMTSLWSLQYGLPFSKPVSSKQTDFNTYQRLEKKLVQNVFNTPGEIHLIQVYDNFDDIVIDTAKKYELKGLIFNLKSHQTLQHSIAHTILPYYTSHSTAMNSLALRGRYLLSWEQDQLSAIFNEMLHQSLVLNQYLSSEGFHVLLDAFQNTISEYSVRHPDIETRLHILIQRPEVLMAHQGDGDQEETVTQFMKMLETLVENCQITVIMLPQKFEFVQWIQRNYDFEDSHHWFIGEQAYNDTITWFNNVYGSLVTPSQMKRVIHTVGTRRKHINRLMQKVVRGRNFTDVLQTYSEEAMFQFTAKVRALHQPGMLVSLFEDFSKSASNSKQLYCPQPSPITTSAEYGTEYLEGLEDMGLIYLQRGVCLYGNCDCNVYRPVMKFLTGYREFKLKKITVLPVQVNNKGRIYNIELQELRVCHLLERLEDHGIDTTKFEYFTVNSTHWYHCNIYRNSDNFLKYLTKNSQLYMKSEEIDEIESRPPLVRSNDKQPSSEEEGWIGWFVSFVW